MTNWLDTLLFAMMKMSLDFHVSAHCLTQEVILTEMKFKLHVFIGPTRTQTHQEHAALYLGFSAVLAKGWGETGCNSR